MLDTINSLWEDFGQKIDLCVRLREILRNYPEGISILKELIQNADDAGARTIRFCASEPRPANASQSGPLNEATANLNKLLNVPSLLVFNSAKFLEHDFLSIQNIGESLKKGTNKTGRFGVGFNSTYHLTDVPMFVSGTKIVLFDPHAIYVPGINPQNPGKLIDCSKAEGRRLVQAFAHLFSPLRAFGCSLNGDDFDGTLFRFALRSEDQGMVSRLSSQHYTFASIKCLLRLLAREASSMLIFLKNIECIEIYDWEVVSDQPVLVHRTRINPLSDIVRAKRSYILNVPHPFPKQVEIVDYQLVIESDVIISSDGAGLSISTETWMICNQLGGNRTTQLAHDPSLFQMALFPWAGVAIRCTPTLESSGKAYCFLPLPVDTSLPVHVNGYFELSSNRRDIWWGEDMAGDGKARADWNKSLIQEVVAQCYCRLAVSLLRSDFITPKTYEFIFPQTHALAEPWKILTAALFQGIFYAPVLYSKSSVPDHWVKPADAVILRDDDNLSLVQKLPLFNISLVLPGRRLKENLLIYAKKITTISAADLIRLHLVPYLSSLSLEVTQDAMREVLLSLHTISLSDSSIVSFLAKEKCIPSHTTNTLSAPSALYDPHVGQLLTLMDSDLFPNDFFSETDMLQSLRKLGLRSTLTWEVVIECAQSIEKDVILSKTNQTAYSRALELITFLDSNEKTFFPNKTDSAISKASRLFQKVTSAIFDESEDKRLCERMYADRLHILVNTRWLPVIAQPSHPLLPWRSSEISVVAPKETASYENVWLVSSMKYFSTHEVTSISIKKIFGWYTKVSARMVAYQLKELASNFMKLSADTATDLDMLCRKVSEHVPRIYSILNGADDDEVEDVKSLLGNGTLWLWMGRTFVASECVAFSCPLYATPYLFTVPSDLACFRRLLNIFGVRAVFSSRDYYLVLRRLAAEKVIDVKIIELSVCLVQLISDDVMCLHDLDMYAPTETGEIKPTRFLLYDDAPWLGRDIAGKTSLTYLHPKLSSTVADRIGVRSLRKHLLQSTSNMIDFGDEVVHEAFTQSESLTNRLKNIIELYPEGTQQLYELIQNADDAKATIVRFIVSLKKYGDSSLLGRGLREWQGPALYCYNNSVFSELDFRNVSRIGQTSKLQRLDTTGRFGLGFNSVYHWTDVPSFVSGDSLVFFDPHKKYVPGSTGGVKIKFAGSFFADHFPDQIAPFILCGCNMKEYYNGTLFRFPFRNKATVADSEISRTAYTEHSIKTLIRDSPAAFQHVLLFLRNVEKIELYLQSTNEDEPSLLCCASRQIIQRHNCIEWDLSQFSSSMSKEAVYTKLSGLSERELPKTSEIVNVSLEKLKNNHAILDDWFLAEEETYSQNFLVCSAFGGGECRNMALDHSFREMKFLPWASIAAPLDRNTISLVERGKAYCFLPLPTVTGFPVHINGCFELSSNRRDLWAGSDMTGTGLIRSKWNHALLREVVAPLYCDMLEAVKNLVGTYEQYYSLWPVEVTSEIWKIVRQVVLSRALTRPLFHCSIDGGIWVPSNDAIFFAADRKELQESSFIENIIPMLLELSICVVNIPSILLQSIKNEACAICELSPEVIRDALIGRSLRFDAICKLWDYLVDEKDGGPSKKITLFRQKVSILPTRDGENIRLIELARGREVMDCTNRNCAFMDIPKMLEILRSIGIKIFEESLFSGRDRTEICRRIREFIQPYSGLGFLNALSETLSRDLDQKSMIEVLALRCAHLSVVQKDQLRNFIIDSRDEYYEADESLSFIIRSLPIYEVYNFADEHLYTHIVDGKCIAPSSSDPQLLNSSFIKVCSDAERLFFQKLGIIYLNLADYYEQYLCPLIAAGKLTSKLMEKAVTKILQDSSSNNEINPDWYHRISKINFIPNRQGCFVSASTLVYDPEDPELINIVHESFLPAKFLCDRALVKTLTWLGMKNKLSLKKVLECARSIKTQLDYCSKDDPALKSIQTQALSLLSFLDSPENFKDLLSESSHSDAMAELTEIVWLPVEQLQNLNETSQSHCQHSFASPRHARPKHDEWFCNATVAIVSQAVNSQHLLEFFGWNKPLHANVIASQIISIAKHYQSTPVPSSYKMTMLEMLPQIYDRLNTMLGVDRDNQEALALLRRNTWVWVADSFVMSEQVALHASPNMDPYLHPFPSELLCYENLVKSCSIRQSFTSIDYGRALSLMADELNGRGCNNKQLELAVTFSQLLGNADKEEIEHVNRVFGCFLPARNHSMYRSRTLIFDDAPWLSEIIGKKLKEELVFVHSNIDMETARKLGCKSMRSTFLTANQDNGVLKIPCPRPESIELLISKRTACPDEACKIIKELLEVAEMFGTKQVSIFFDHRQHQTVSLLHSCLGTAQGPSICICMHDITIDTADIVRLTSPALFYTNVATKMEGCGGAGFPRYGRGLCGVYSLTDCLQILSAKAFVIFDPSGRHLVDEKYALDCNHGQTTTPSARHYELTIDLLNSFSDQFAPFISAPFGLDDAIVNCKESCQGLFFKGTIIRLPLRTQATTFSLRKDALFDEANIGEIIQATLRMVPSSYLFLCNLETVSVSQWRIPDSHYQMILHSRVSSCPIARKNHMGDFRANTKWKKGPLLRKFFLGEWIPEFSHYFFEVRYSYMDSSEEIIEKYTIISLLAPKLLQNLATEELSSLELLPVVSAAARISSSFCSIDSRSDGSIFVGLGTDLNIHSGVPMHLNMPLFLHEWTGNILLEPNDDADVKALFPNMRYIKSGLRDYSALFQTWNKHCLVVAVNDLLPRLLETIRNFFVAQNDAPRFYMYWPELRRIQAQYGPIINATLLKALASKEFFLKQNKFFHAGEAVFEDPSYDTPNTLHSIFELFSVPRTVVEDLIHFSVDIRVFTPSVARRLLRSKRIKQCLLSRPLDALTALEYCLLDLADEYDFSVTSKAHAICNLELIGLTILPLSDGTVGTIGESVIIADSGQQLMLPHLIETGRFVANFAVERLQHILSRTDFLKSCGLARFSPEILLKHVTSVLPASYEDKDFVPWNPEEDMPSRLWIYQFWKEVPIWNSDLVHLFRRWPLVPTNTNELASCSHVRLIASFIPQLANASIQESILQEFQAKIDDFTRNEKQQFSSHFAGTARRCGRANGKYWKTEKLDQEFVHSEENCRLSDIEPTENRGDNLFTLDKSDPQSKSSNPLHWELADILGRLRCPMLAPAYYASDDLNQILPPDRISLSRTVLTMISYCTNQWRLSRSERLEWSRLTGTDCENLLMALTTSEVGSRLSLSNLDLSLLKQLPVFEYFDGKRGPLLQTGQNYSMSSIVASGLLHHIQPSMRSNVLIEKLQYLELYEDLHVQQLDEVTAINEFLLKKFQELPDHAKGAVVKVISERWSDCLRHNEAILSSLRAIPFVRKKRKSGDVIAYVTANQIYDPRVRFFAVIFGDAADCFPEEDFLNDITLDILSCAGMKSVVDKDIFLKAALAIEEENSVTKGLFLWEYYAANFTSFHDINGEFTARLGKIKCVPAEKEGVTELFYFSDIAIPRDRHLAFKVLPIAPETIVPPQVTFSSLHVVSPPSISTVLKTLRALTELGEDAGLSWTYKHGTIEEVFGSIFCFLQENFTKLSSRVLGGLKELSMIPVDGILLKPKHVFFRLPKDLSPLIWELPRCFTASQRFLVGIGVKETPYVEDYVIALEDLKILIGNGRLNINELNAVLALTSLIVDSSSHILRYLPDTTGRLVLVEELLIDDQPWITNDERIDKSFFHFLHPRFTSLGSDLGIDYVSNRLVQNLLDRPLELVMQPIELMRIQNTIRSRTFFDLMKDIVKDDLRRVEVTLSRMNLVASENINTKFSLIHKEKRPAIDVTNYETHKTCHVFVDDKMTIFVSSPIALYATLIGLSICDIFHIDRKHALCISALLGSDNEIVTVSEIMVLGDDSCSEINRGFPGSTVVPADLVCMELKANKIYRKGEIVAIKSIGGDDDSFVYGIVSCHTIGSSFSRLRVETSRQVFVDLLSSQVWSLRSCTAGKSKTQHTTLDVSPHVVQTRNSDKTLPPMSVERNDVLRVVEDLLAQSNLSLTGNAEEFLVSNLELKDKISKLESFNKISIIKGEEVIKNFSTLFEVFLCPITREVMQDPVICSDGHTYERYAIEMWLQTSTRSPRTNENLTSRTVIPNISMRIAIEELKNSTRVLREFDEHVTNRFCSTDI